MPVAFQPSQNLLAVGLVSKVNDQYAVTRACEHLGNRQSDAGRCASDAPYAVHVHLLPVEYVL